jgi:putative flippase GtrA
MDLKSSLAAVIRSEKVRFLLVGGFNVACGYLLFAALFLLFGDMVHYLVIGVVTHVIAVSIAYHAYHLFVFADAAGGLRSFLRFHLVNLANLGLSIAALTILVELVHLTPIVAQGISIAIIVVLSYVLHKRFSFAS